MISSEANWRSRTDKARAVEERLRGIMSANRGLIHMFEKEDEGRVRPFDTLYDIERNIPKLLDKDYGTIGPTELATISASLMPSPDTGHSVVPFCEIMHGRRLNDNGTAVGYFINASESQPNPARVIRVFAHQPVTGFDNFNKILKLDFEYDPKLLSLFTEEYKRSCPQGHEPTVRGAYINDVVKNPASYAKKIDDLAATFPRNGTAKPLPWNEVVAAITPQNIEAIIVPLSESMKTKKDGLYEAHARLRGALSGLAHLKAGMDLPVVFYHVDGTKQGQCTFLAQGKEQFTEVAKKAILDLQNNPNFSFLATEYHSGALDTADYVKEHLSGLDLFTPLSQQGVDISKVVGTPLNGRAGA